MAKTLLTTSNNTSNSSGTDFWPLGITFGSNDRPTEANTQMTYRLAGTLSLLWCNVTSNTTTAASTLRTRVNGVNGNMSVSIPNATTGEFEDSTNTDAVASADEVNYQLVTGGTGSVNPSVISSVFDATSNTVVKFAGYAGGGLAISSASTTQYLTLAGGEMNGLTTEANRQTEINTAGTLKNLFLYISANTRTTATTFRARINGANGNQSISVAGSSSGIFEDTVNTDTIAANDLVNSLWTTGTGIGTLTLYLIALDLETTNSKFSFASGDALSLAQGTTRFLSIGGGMETPFSVSGYAVDMNIGATLSNFVIYISANSLDVTATFDVLVNNAASVLTLSILTGQTGRFEDTDSVTVVSTDEVEYKSVAPSGTGSLVFNSISLLCENTEGGVAAAQIHSNLLLMGVG